MGKNGLEYPSLIRIRVLLILKWQNILAELKESCKYIPHLTKGETIMAKKAVAKKTKKTKVTPLARKKALKKPGKKVVKKTAIKRKKKVQAIPKNYHSITPYLIIDGAAKAIDFYKKVFGAKEAMRMESPAGKIAHAELKIGDSKIMLADECLEMDARGPRAYGGSAITIHLYVKNVDATVEKAVSAGAKIVRKVEDMFYGDRSGTLEDPFGHKWHVSTHIEDVTPAKIRKRAAEMFGKKKSS